MSDLDGIRTRKPPPGLVTASLVLWAFATGRWTIAALLAIAIEGARWAPLRIAVSDRAFARLAIATRLAFVAVLGWLATELPIPVALLSALGWLPVVLAIVAVPQAWSAGGLAPINVLRMFRAADRDRIGIDLGYAFTGITLLAAAGSTRELPFFFPALCALTGWALFSARPPRRGPRAIATWLGLFVAVALLGQAFHTGLSALQGRIEERAMALMDRWMPMRTPLDRTRTRIGDVGRVKLADTIVLRVRPDAGIAAPFLVLDGAFSRYDNGIWTNRGARHERLPALEGDATLRELVPDAATQPVSGTMEITLRPTRAIAMMPLPAGADRVVADPALQLAWNQRGALHAEHPPALLRYRAVVPRSSATLAPPDADDLEIPSRIASAIDLAFAETGAETLAPGAAVRAIRRFFREGFQYTTWLGDATHGGRSLGAFLTAERAGHCEYFAAATTLMLRRAGIPARYATGYAVEEWSELEDGFVVRARHGHAWALAWLGGRWVEVDTTPSVWRSLDATAHRSAFEPLADLWAWLGLRFDEWRSSGGRLPRSTLPVLLGLVALVVLWKMRGGIAGAAAAIVRRERSVRAGPRASPLAAIEHHFTRSGRARAASESLGTWATRLAAHGHLDAHEAATLQRLVNRWYALHFGKATGAGAPGEADLARDAEAWLRTHRRRPREATATRREPWPAR